MSVQNRTGRPRRRERPGSVGGRGGLALAVVAAVVVPAVVVLDVHGGVEPRVGITDERGAAVRRLYVGARAGVGRRTLLVHEGGRGRRPQVLHALDEAGGVGDAGQHEAVQDLAHDAGAFGRDFRDLDALRRTAEGQVDDAGASEDTRLADAGPFDGGPVRQHDHGRSFGGPVFGLRDAGGQDGDGHGRSHDFAKELHDLPSPLLGPKTSLLVGYIYSNIYQFICQYC